MGDMFEATGPSNLTRAPRICANFTKPVVLDDQAAKVHIELNTFSTVATSVCNDHGCQMDLHVMFFVANANPTHVLEAAGEYSIDGWATSASEVGIYEQHLNLRSDGLYKQAWQFNAEL